MDFYTNHFRCEVIFEGLSETLSLDTTPLRQTKAVWIVEGKLLLLEFEEEVLANTFQDIWDRISAQSDKIISATMYDWDALDQHPGCRTVFKRGQ